MEYEKDHSNHLPGSQACQHHSRLHSITAYQAESSKNIVDREDATEVDCVGGPCLAGRIGGATGPRIRLFIQAEQLRLHNEKSLPVYHNRREQDIQVDIECDS